MFVTRAWVTEPWGSGRGFKGLHWGQRRVASRASEAVPFTYLKFLRVYLKYSHPPTKMDIFISLIVLIISQYTRISKYQFVYLYMGTVFICPFYLSHMKKKEKKKKKSGQGLTGESEPRVGTLGVQEGPGVLRKWQGAPSSRSTSVLEESGG